VCVTRSVASGGDPPGVGQFLPHCRVSRVDRNFHASASLFEKHPECFLLRLMQGRRLQWLGYAIPLTSRGALAIRSSWQRWFPLRSSYWTSLPMSGVVTTTLFAIGRSLQVMVNPSPATNTPFGLAERRLRPLELGLLSPVASSFCTAWSD